MNKEKQIEEMAKAMCWEGAECSNCEGLLPCDKKYYAPRLVEKGYRKASEVAREIFAEIERMCIDTFGNFNHRVFAELQKKYTEEGK